MLEFRGIVTCVSVGGNGSSSESQRMLIRIGRPPVPQTALVLPPPSRLALLLCTVSNTAPRRYVLEGNVQRLFKSFLADGKMTIRLRSPAIDVCIKEADPDSLRASVSLIEAKSGGSLAAAVPAAVLAPSNGVLKPPKLDALKDSLQAKYTVDAQRKFPAEFPARLSNLVITNRDMKKVDERVYALKDLKCLEISITGLQTLDTTFFSHLQTLTVLKLSNNALDKLPPQICDMTSLVVLDLRGNKITRLPMRFWSLRTLTHLHLDDNPLVCLPDRMNNMKSLRVFTASTCKLQWLPIEVSKLRYQKIDFSGNPFSATAAVKVRIGPATLIEYCARQLVAMRHNPKELKMGAGIDALFGRGRACTQCNGAYFDRHMNIVQVLETTHLADTVVSRSGEWEHRAPFLHRWCSSRCAKTNPYFTKLPKNYLQMQNLDHD